MEEWFLSQSVLAQETAEWIPVVIKWVIDSDEFSLAGDILSLALHLMDLRFVGLVVVSVYVFLWSKLEALAATRAETERKQAETNYDCEGRRSLRDYCIDQNGELFGKFTFYDFFHHVGTQGRHKPNMHNLCSMVSHGVIWRTPHLIVSSTPVNTSLNEEVLGKTATNIDQGLHKVRMGGKLEVLDKEISRNFLSVRYYVNCDDPDAFLSLFQDESMMKRLARFSARQVIEASYDFKAKTMTLKGSEASVTVLKNMTPEELYSFALVSAHLSYQRPK